MIRVNPKLYSIPEYWTSLGSVGNTLNLQQVSLRVQGIPETERMSLE